MSYNCYKQYVVQPIWAKKMEKYISLKSLGFNNEIII